MGGRLSIAVMTVTLREAIGSPRESASPRPLYEWRVTRPDSRPVAAPRICVGRAHQLACRPKLDSCSIDLMISESLGRYRILSKLGEGGMGAVYHARDERLERDVALKLLTPGTMSDENARRRFRKEAMLLSQLNHPNIATVHDFDTHDGMDFLVLELIPGGTLSEVLANGPLPPAQFGSLALQLAQGLEAAHERGIVHRDLKPSNLQLTVDGRLKILDFGLAVLRQRAEASATLTLTGGAGLVIAGTIPYMAPEQLRGEAVDSRADIHAAGAVFYEMLTGSRAFPQKAGPELVAAILHQRPAALPGRVGKIVARCLQKRADQRYQTATELRADLERLAATRTAKARSKDAREVRALAVLPLQNLSGSPEQQYFADGLTETLITGLAQIGGLRVISRYSVMQYKDGKTPLARIARALRVEALIIGSVLRSGDRVRITAQLIDPATERHLWAESYEREMSDILKLQAEMTCTIMSQIQVRLSAEQESALRGQRSVNPLAYDHYLRGRALCGRLNARDNEAGLQMLERGTEIDPKFAAAHATTALAYVDRFFFFDPSPVCEQRARAEADLALRLDPGLAEAHVARGRLLWTPANGFPHLEAIREFREAARINASLDEAHTNLAVIYNHIGLLEEGLQTAQRAAAINPSGTTGTGHILLSMLWSGRYEDFLSAATFVRRGEVLPAFTGSQLAWALTKLGRQEEARRTVEEFSRLDPSDTGGFLSSFQAWMLAEAGDEIGAAEKIQAASSKKAFFHFHHASFFIACAYAQMHRPAEAVEWARYTAENGFPCYPLFANETGLDPVRGDASFAEFVAELRRDWQSYQMGLFPPKPQAQSARHLRQRLSGIGTQ